MTRYHREDIRVASPCNADWEVMQGDERMRFCSQCRLHVYNLSAMSRPEAETLVRQKEGRLCVRFYRRSDGTMLTEDCPVGLQLVRRLARKGRIIAAAPLVILGLLFSGFLFALPSKGNRSSLRDIEPFTTILEWIDPSPPRVIMGKVCPPRDSLDDKRNVPVPEPGEGKGSS